MNNDVKVTVICLCYNHEKYIRQALDGIVSQKTDFKFEAIVHDDASTDASADIIREYAGKYPDIIKPIIQTENQWSKARYVTKTLLVPMVKSKYIAFCECDDFWCDENKLQKQFDVMEDNHGLSMCTHRVQCVGEDGIKTGASLPSDGYGVNKTGVILQNDYAGLLFEKGGYPFHTSSFFMRAETLQCEFYRDFKVGINGDQLFSFSSLNKGDIYYIDETMSCRRTQVPGSYNARLKQKSQEELFAIQKKYIEAIILVDRLCCEKFHDKIVKCVYNRIINSFFKYDFKMVYAYFKDVNIRYKFKFGLDFKLSCLYVMTKYLPHVMKLYVSKKSTVKE